MKFITKKALNGLFPFVGDIRRYNNTKFQKDIIAALTVAIIALPQSMAYAIIAGVHPKYGLYAAAIPTIVASLFGASRYLIAGPTNAISMVVASSMGTAMIAGTIAQDLPEEQKISLIFLLAFLVGAIQIIMGMLRFGKLVNFISHSVIIGFTAGAGILIAFNQIKNLVGIETPRMTHFYEKMHQTFLHIDETNFYALGLGLFTIIFILALKKFTPKLPRALLAMVVCSIGVALFDLGAKGVQLVGEIPQTFPPLSFFPTDLQSITALISAAAAIAILGIVEALSIAKSIASTSGEKINGNQEFIAQGLSNITSAFTSSIPGSGSFTRSAVNFNAGAGTRFAGAFSGIFIIITILVAAPLAKFIPIPSLAGILMVIAYSMINKEAFVLSFKTSKSDRVVLLATMASTLIFHLEVAIYIGVALSILLFLRKVAMPNVREVAPLGASKKLHPVEGIEDAESKMCPQMSIYQIEGSLFFGAIERLEEQISKLHTTEKVLIIRMKQVQVIDATGVHALEQLLKTYEGRIILTGINIEIRRALRNTGLLDKMNVVTDTQKAVELAFKKYINPEVCKNCQKKVFDECHGNE